MKSTIKSLYRIHLQRVGFRDGELDQIMDDLHPFFIYLEEECGVIDLSGLTAHHISAYERIIRGRGFDLTDIYAVLALNRILLSLKQFCLLMHSVGFVAHDYGKGIELMKMPKLRPAILPYRGKR